MVNYHTDRSPLKQTLLILQTSGEAKETVAARAVKSLNMQKNKSNLEKIVLRTDGSLWLL